MFFKKCEIALLSIYLHIKHVRPKTIFNLLCSHFHCVSAERWKITVSGVKESSEGCNEGNFCRASIFRDFQYFKSGKMGLGYDFRDKYAG